MPGYVLVVDRLARLLARSPALKDVGEVRGRAVTALLSMTAVVGLLAACGTNGGADPISAPVDRETTTSMDPIPEASPTTKTHEDGPTHGIPAFPKNTARQVERSSGGAELVFTDVRVAEHQSFDRIVLEFSGPGIPGWAVNYVSKAVLDGSGEAVTLGGDAILDIYASGTTWPAPDYYDGPGRLEPHTGDVKDVFVGGTFEGYTQVIAGIDGERVPFRVFALTDPSRLVVDVAHRGTG